MAIGKVTIVKMDYNQGPPKEVERCFLFIGKSAIKENWGKIIAIAPQTDLEIYFGKSDLTEQLKAAIANAASDNFFAYAIGLGDVDGVSYNELIENIVDGALEKPNSLPIEGVVVCLPVTEKQQVNNLHATASTMIAKYAKFLSFHVAVRGAEAEDWTTYKSAIKEINNGVAAERVYLVPQLHGNNLGVVAGRLCNPAASLADTPMRVATGAVIGLGEDPTDKNGMPLTMADIEDLAKARFSVPQWYTDYEGIYWADHSSCAAAGSDYQEYEHLRVVDWCSRRVRLRALARIADRRLNSTPASIEANKTYLGAPLREAAKPVYIGGVEQPAMIQTPSSEDISITWTNRTSVAIGITVKPHNCPKHITVYIGLDLSGE